MKLRVLFPLLALVFSVWPAAAVAQTADSAADAHDDSHAPVVARLAPEAGAKPSSLPGALTVNQIEEQIAEAKRILKAGASDLPSDSVRLAALERSTGQIHTIQLTKDSFLTRGAQLLAITSLGHQARVYIARANGVNTAVVITDETSKSPLVPLVVQYPIVRNGSLTQTAYYTSAHPALLSTELIASGRSYVRSRLDGAAVKLRAEGLDITPEIVDIAEHLAIVEHTDHQRFKSEDKPALFNEILSLYALNQGDTYRYSVSTAGAGGMIQMIPSTYDMVRRRHPSIDLKADFVDGMTDHDNAALVMLLYMQDTWDDLLKSEEVRGALDSGLATQEELVAAGYNSNPARLASYLRRGGDAWRTLIPSETQMYLAIYGSLDGSAVIKTKTRPRTILRPEVAAVARRSTVLASFVRLFVG
ncbi:MAG TPA: hypothetical protein VJS44_17800 [Pyrinomonadaceae bacterium]|nr:hypothetical protein [Pyrinomonadaceae bacterium]